MRATLMMLFFLAAAGPPAIAQGPGIAAKKAWKLFQQKDFRQAGDTFREILQKWPGHEDSRTGLARSLYAQKRYREASRTFRTINLSKAPASLSYEYGMTMYHTRNWQEALAGLRRVPESHSHSDLAAWYGAKSAWKLDRPAEADRLLDRAVVLPSSLRASRAALRSKIRRRLLERQPGKKSRRARTTRPAPTVVKERRFTGIPTRKESPQPKPAARDSQSRPSGGAGSDPFLFPAARRVRAGARKIQQQITWQNDTGTTNGATTFFLELQHGFRTGPVKPAISSSILNLQFDLRVDQRRGGRKEMIMDPHPASWLYHYGLQDDEVSRNAQIQPSIWYQHPLGKDLALAAAARLLLIQPGLSDGQVLRDQSLHLAFGYLTRTQNIRLAAAWHQAASSETGALLSRGREEMQASIRLNHGIEVRAGTIWNQYYYSDNTLPGPDTDQLWFAELGMLFTEAVYVGIQGDYLTEVDVRSFPTGADSINRISSWQSSTGGTLILRCRPVHWLTVQGHSRLRYTTLERTAPSDDAARLAGEGVVPGHINETLMLISVHKDF